MNGVINIVTKKAADTQGGSFYGAAGTRDFEQGHVRFPHPQLERRGRPLA
jgi:outer membrane receptor protein involved in Fe transport